MATQDDYDYGAADDYQEEFDVYNRQAYFPEGIYTAEGDHIFLDKRTKGDIIKDANRRFVIYTDAIARNLNDRNIISMSYNDIKNMLGLIAKISNIKYKNPTAFVLGYAVTKTGNRIDGKVLLSLEPNLKKLDVKITLADVLRYATMWLRIRS